MEKLTLTETKPIIDYFSLKNKIKDMLTIIVEKLFFSIYEKLSDKEKTFFDLTNFNLKLKWVINVNTVNTNRGDISTSTLQKFFHGLFRNINELEEQYKNEDDIKGDFLKFKNTFIELFNVNLIITLSGENLLIDEVNLADYIAKFEDKNGFLNIFLNSKGREILDEMKNKKRNNSNEQEKDNQFSFNSLGTIESCFPEKFSVPRQGNLLELSRAKVILNKNVDMSSFDGIENFDYIWIIYVFHLNINFSKAKISPPKFEGKKLGVFATRSPHRYNPIGLTLAKLERIEKNEIFISSVDMISGTPVLDIKPYHHLESIDIEKMKYPQWIKDSASEEKKAEVKFTENAKNNLHNILQNHKLMFYDNFDDLISLIKGVLEIDPHSKYTQKKQDVMVYAFYVDKLNVIYEYDARNKEVIIQGIEFYEEYKKLRNKDWLEKNYNKSVNI